MELDMMISNFIKKNEYQPIVFLKETTHHKVLLLQFSKDNGTQH